MAGVIREFFEHVGQLARCSVYRLRHDGEGVRYESQYFWSQLKAVARRDMHLYAEAHVRHSTKFKVDGVVVEHKVFDYIDPPDHTVIGCWCGAEWS